MRTELLHLVLHTPVTLTVGTYTNQLHGAEPPSWEVKSHSASQEIPHPLWDPLTYFDDCLTSICSGGFSYGLGPETSWEKSTGWQT
jgi:hypothetical protein